MSLKLNVFKPRSYIRIVKFVLVISVIVTVTLYFFNAYKKRAEDKQKALDVYAQKLLEEKVKLQEARDNPFDLSNDNDGVSSISLQQGTLNREVKYYPMYNITHGTVEGVQHSHILNYRWRSLYLHEHPLS